MYMFNFLNSFGCTTFITTVSRACVHVHMLPSLVFNFFKSLCVRTRHLNFPFLNSCATLHMYVYYEFEINCPDNPNLIRGTLVEISGNLKKSQEISWKFGLAGQLISNL